MFKQFGVSTNKIYLEDFFKDLFQTTLRKEQRSAPFVQHSVHSFLLAEISQNEMLKQCEASSNEIYQKGCLKVPALNGCTKGVKIGSFRRASCS